jgi:HTH-type transcriptional regulator, sugar sensing transcriptional regulator
MDLQDCLIETGLTGQEAALYVSLCREGQLTGYEAAKVSGISRSNAYHALSALVDKGAAHRIEGDPASYAPVPPKDYARNVKRRMDAVLSRLEEALPEAREPSAPFLSVQGRDRIIEKMKNMIEDTRLRIYLSMAAEELGILRGELEAAFDRGVKVVVITDGLSPRGSTSYARKKRPGQVRLISDTEHVLTGEIGAEGGSCVYSRNPALIRLIKDSLADEMELAGEPTVSAPGGD